MFALSTLLFSGSEPTVVPSKTTTTTSRTITIRTTKTTHLPSTTAQTLPKVIESHRYPVDSSPDIRFNPEKFNIRLTPVNPPIIKSSNPSSFRQQAYNSEEPRITLTTHNSVFKNEDRFSETTSSTQEPKSVVSYGLQHTINNKNKNYKHSYDYNYQQTENADIDYNTDVPSSGYLYEESNLKHFDQHSSLDSINKNKEYQKNTNQFPSTTKTSEISYHSSSFPSLIQDPDIYNYQHTDKPNLQIPQSLIPTLPPLTFSTPAPFTLTRHFDQKRSNTHYSPPRVIISASASVSDATGKRLNYSLGTIGTSHIIGTAPASYDDYRESDVVLDPFYHDVPKISSTSKKGRHKRNIDEYDEETTHWTPPDYVDDNYEPLIYEERKTLENKNEYNVIDNHTNSMFLNDTIKKEKITNNNDFLKENSTNRLNMHEMKYNYSDNNNAPVTTDVSTFSSEIYFLNSTSDSIRNRSNTKKITKEKLKNAQNLLDQLVEKLLQEAFIGIYSREKLKPTLPTKIRSSSKTEASSTTQIETSTEIPFSNIFLDDTNTTLNKMYDVNTSMPNISLIALNQSFVEIKNHDAESNKKSTDNEKEMFKNNTIINKITSENLTSLNIHIKNESNYYQPELKTNEPFNEKNIDPVRQSKYLNENNEDEEVIDKESNKEIKRNMDLQEHSEHNSTFENMTYDSYEHIVISSPAPFNNNDISNKSNITKDIKQVLKSDLTEKNYKLNQTTENNNTSIIKDSDILTTDDPVIGLITHKLTNDKIEDTTTSYFSRNIINDTLEINILGLESRNPVIDHLKNVQDFTTQASILYTSINIGQNSNEMENSKNIHTLQTKLQDKTTSSHTEANNLIHEIKIQNTSTYTNILGHKNTLNKFIDDNSTILLEHELEKDNIMEKMVHNGNITNFREITNQNNSKITLNVDSIPEITTTNKNFNINSDILDEINLTTENVFNAVTQNIEHEKMNTDSMPETTTINERINTHHDILEKITVTTENVLSTTLEIKENENIQTTLLDTLTEFITSELPYIDKNPSTTENMVESITIKEELTKIPRTTNSILNTEQASVKSRHLPVDRNKKLTTARHRFSSTLVSMSPAVLKLQEHRKFPATTETIYNINSNLVTDSDISKSANPTESRILFTSTTPFTKYQEIKKNNYDKSKSFNCINKKLNRFYEDPRDCRLFHYCTPGFSETQVLDMKFVCDFGTYFNIEKLICTKIKPRRCK